MSDRRRQEGFQLAAARLGLAFTYEDLFGLLDLPFELLTRGDGRGVETILYGTWQGMAVQVFDYWYYEETSNGKTTSRTTYRFSCVVTPIDARCPHLTIAPENLLTRLADALALDDLQFESEAFNRGVQREGGPRARRRALRRADDDVAPGQRGRSGVRGPRRPDAPRQAGPRVRVAERAGAEPQPRRRARRARGKPKIVKTVYLGSADQLVARFAAPPSLPEPQSVEVLAFADVAALFDMAQQIQLVPLIDARLTKRDQGLSLDQYLLLAAINRATHPTSKTRFAEWYQRTVLTRLIPASADQLSSQSILESL